MNKIEAYLNLLASQVVQVEAQSIVESLDDYLVLDIREASELKFILPNALHLPRAMVELKIGSILSDNSSRSKILLYCSAGNRSLITAKNLIDMGIQEVYSLKGGIESWMQAGLKTRQAQDEMLSPQQKARYIRHLNIPQVGEAGQKKLLNSSVLVVGAGGLGSPAAIYLAAAGVGRIGLIDDDLVDESNLQRQILHDEESLNQKKVSSAERRLKALNSEVKIETFDSRLSETNAEKIIADFDLIVDGSDNFRTRYLINDSCIAQKRPFVHAAIFRFEGQMSLFDPSKPGHACYRCLFPQAPKNAMSCSDAGVLGVLPGIMGCLQASEAIKYLLGIGKPMLGRFLSFDALGMKFSEFSYSKDPSCEHELSNL